MRGFLPTIEADETLKAAFNKAYESWLQKNNLTDSEDNFQKWFDEMWDDEDEEN